MDLVVMRRLAAELDERLRGGRIERVWALPRNDVVIAIDRRSGPRLWFSSEPDEPHLYLRAGGHPTPARPPGFAMAARNLLVGRRVAAVVPLHGDRLVQVTCAGDDAPRLVLELIPRRATAYVLDGAGQIKVVWQPRRGRPGPGERYEPPGSDTRPALEQVEESTWESLAAAPNGDDLVRGLLRSVAGMSPLVAREVAVRQRAGADVREVAAEQLQRAAGAATDARIYAPEPLDALAALPPARRFLLAPYPLEHLEAAGMTPAATYDSLAEAAAAFYPLRACLAVLQTARDELASALELTVARLQRTRDAVENDAAEAGNPQELRVWADLLLAYPNAPRRGDAVHVPDPNAGAGGSAEIAIPIDPALSRIDNAQANYNLARRAERSATRTAQRRARLRAAIDALEGLRQDAQGARDLATCVRLARAARPHGATPAIERWERPECAAAGDDGEVAAATAASGERAARTSAPHRRAPPRGEHTPPGIDVYASSDGFEILVGRSARANERLTHKLAAPHDFWLHAEGPGSHVLIRNPRRAEQPSADALRQAAALAAYFSRARGATKVNVRWTQARHVKKPRGAPTGQVILRQSHTVLAEPVSPEELFSGNDD